MVEDRVIGLYRTELAGALSERVPAFAKDAGTGVVTATFPLPPPRQPDWVPAAADGKVG